jgi:hypothetical protein
MVCTDNGASWAYLPVIKKVPVTLNSSKRARILFIPNIESCNPDFHISTSMVSAIVFNNL